MPFGILAKAVPVVAKAVLGGAKKATASNLVGGVSAAAGVVRGAPQLGMPLPGVRAPTGPAGGGQVQAYRGGVPARYANVPPGPVRAASGRVSGIMSKTGRFFPMAKVRSLIKSIGLDAAALALGITVANLAMSYADSKPTRRRGRGISAADVRRTCRTLGQINRIQARLKSCTTTTSCAPRTYRRRKA